MLFINNISLILHSNTIYNNISFNVFRNDKIGLIGKNGAGKSTLIKIINGEYYPYTGDIIKEKNIKLGYLSQDIDFDDRFTLIEEVKKSFAEIQEIEKKINHVNTLLSTKTNFESEEYTNLLNEHNELISKFKILGGYMYEAEIEKILTGLGFKNTDFNKNTKEFSGGWRMRIELAKILLQNNDVLLLDEPTNHLDIDSVIWFEKFLKNFKGSIILISHDKTLLDNVTNRTIEISNGNIYDYKCNYSNFLKSKETINEQIKSKAKIQEREIATKERLIEKFRSKQSKASFAQKLIKELDKIERINVEKDDYSKINIEFISEIQPGKIILETKKLGKYYQSEIFSDINMIITRGEKISFVGQNGQGKSTFVKIITQKIKDFEGEFNLGHNVKIGYFAQNQSEELDGDITIFDTIFNSATEDKRPLTRKLLGNFLFSGDDINKKVKVLSGGEKNRLAICKMLVQPYNVLIMDEPTNHLDIHSKNILKKSLQKFDGTLLIVSHDRDFLDGLTNKCYEFKEGKIREYLGGINFFLEQKELDKDENNPKNNTINKGNIEMSNEKEKKNLENKIQKIEFNISKLEEEIKKIELNLYNNSEDLQNNNSIFEKYEKKKKEIEILSLEWEKLIENLN